MNKFLLGNLHKRISIFVYILISAIGPIACAGTTTNDASTPTATIRESKEAQLKITQTSIISPTTTIILEPMGQLSFGNNVNVRSGPGIEYQVTNVAKPGDTLPIYGRSEDNQWIWVHPIEQVWVNSGVATVDVTITTLPLGPTMASTATRTPIPTQTLRPTSTPIPAISIELVYDNFEDMTDLQFKEYKVEIADKPVRESVRVGNVSERGVVSLSGPWSPLIFNWSDFCVVLTGVPKEEALKLEGGDQIYIEANISGIVGNNNYYINCENTLVLNFKSFGK